MEKITKKFVDASAYIKTLYLRMYHKRILENIPLDYWGVWNTHRMLSITSNFPEAMVHYFIDNYEEIQKFAEGQRDLRIKLSKKFNKFTDEQIEKRTGITIAYHTVGDEKWKDYESVERAKKVYMEKNECFLTWEWKI